MIFFISSWVSQSGVYETHAAGKKSRVVATQEQLEKALKNAGLKKIVIQTKKSEWFSIPKGSYQGVDLVVKAPDADVVNRGVFKQITIASMKRGLYTEAANRNSIRLITSKAALKVQKGYTVRKLAVAKKCTAALAVDGRIEALHVNARSGIKIKGRTGEAVVYINKGGKKSTVETELAVTLRLSADADIVLNEGGGDSRIIISKKNVSYSIKNNTKRDLSLQTAKGKKTLAVGKVYSGKTTEKTPGGGIEITGGSSGGGSTGGGGASGGGSSVTGGRMDYTRGEWVSLLSRSLGFPLTGSVQESLYYFSDTQGKAYGEAAELAQAYGLLPMSDAKGYEDPEQDVPMFEADKKVTREYATYTVVKALGYLEEGAGKPACGDQASLKYEEIDAIGISQGIIELKGGKFLPEEVLSKKDADAMLAKMAGINASAKVTEKVDDVTFDENGDVISIDYAGVSTPDAAKIRAAEGVTCRAAGQRSAKNARGLLADTDSGGSGAPGKYTLKIQNQSVGGGVVNGTVTLDIPDITCRIKAKQGSNGLEFDEFLLAVTNETSVDAALTWNSGYEMTGRPGIPKRGTVKLAEIPCRLGSDLAVDLVVSLEVQAAGDVKISYSVGGVQGIQSIGEQQRIIRGFHQSLEELGAKGSFAVGTKLDCVLKAGQSVVADVSVSTGFDGRVSYVQRADGSQKNCGDGSVFLYGSMKISQSSALGAYLKQWHASETWNIFTRRNTPFLEAMHFEDMVYQKDGCTFGKGSLEGTVVDRDLKSRVIGAKVELMKGGEVICHAFSDGEGKFTFDDIGGGLCTLRVKATGSFAYEMEVEVRRGEKRYVELCIMLDREADAGKGTIKGDIIDATTKNMRIENVSCTVRKNWNNTTGAVVTQKTVSGCFEVELDAGNYTIRFEAAGYVACDVNVVVIGGTKTMRRVGLSPVPNVQDDLVRIILSWGENPSDLDSHLVGHTPEQFHIYFADRKYPIEGDRIADLDRDDVLSFGPETITFYKVNEPGTFSYYVQDYTNLESKSSNQLSLSGAQVRVYVGSELVDRFYVPGNAEGILWHVFDFDMQTKTITPKNIMSYGENDDYIMRDLVYGDDWDEKNK